MSNLEIEKSLFDVRDFLKSSLPAIIDTLNAEIQDGILIRVPKFYEVDKLNIYESLGYPAINLFLGDIDIEALTLGKGGVDEFNEELSIIVADKALNDENIMLKCRRLAEAIRILFNKDSTANNAVEYIRVSKIKFYLPVEGIAVCEIICKIKRAVYREEG